MPTFTTIAFDRLIEPGVAKSMALSRDSNDSRLQRRHSTSNAMKDGEADFPSSKLERGVSTPPNPNLGRGASVPPNPKIEREVLIRSNEKLDMRNSSPATSSDVEQKHHWTQISPALYATPESTPLPDAPSSFPPSPYIINHKRRGPRLMKCFSEDNVANCEPATDEVKVDKNGNDAEREFTNVPEDGPCIPNTVVESTMDDYAKSSSPEDPKENHLNGTCIDKHRSNDVQNGPPGQTVLLKSVSLSLQQEGEDDVFVDLQDSMSARSISEGEGTGWEDRHLKSITPLAEFYDAWEELSSESGSHLLMRDIETESREMRLCLLSEIEKRKQAEEMLNNLRNHWQRLREQLSLAGLTLPVDPTTQPVIEQPVDPEPDLCQQVYIARFVSNAVGRGAARVEVEMGMEAQINLKNFEIARLWDRLHYYEAVNQEMSQRNQEVVETARRLRQRRKRRHQWVWGTIAAAISVGSAVLAYSYFKTGTGSSSQSATRTPEIEHKPN